MAKLLREAIKFDQALTATVGAALAPAAMLISGFFPLGRERKAVAYIGLASATLQDGDVLDFGIVDDTGVAPAASGALAALVAAGDDSVLAFQNITASNRIVAATIDVTAAAAGSVTIDGVVFPFAAIPVAGTGEWSTDAELVAEINALLPYLTATALGANVVGIVSTDPGERRFTIAAAGAWFAAGDLVTLAADAVLEVDASELNPGATGIAVVIDNPVANTGTVDVFVVWARGNARYEPVPQIAG